MRKTAAVAVALGCLYVLVSTASAQEKKAPAAKGMAAARTPMHVVMSEGDIKWGDAPPNLPAGAKMAVLQGDPGKAGMYTIRLKAPDGYKVAAHWHPTAEHLTVISGTFNLGTGDKLDDAKATPMAAGAFASMPARMHHYAWCKGETEVQVSGMGPFRLIYVDPADDPTKAKK
ncbi:MAG: cupin domain-containing protein [Acidobacteriota bacterium]|nr:cupin domain-containing protein [Acidobacteriota bacterium]